MTASDVAPPLSKPDLDLQRPLRMGKICLAALCFIILGWACFSTISGAVIASGQAIVQGKPKVIQSLDGGLVVKILVQEGDTVENGEVLMQLDETLLQVNLDIALNRLAAALALHERLTTEQTGGEVLEFSYPQLPFALPQTVAHEQGQQEIFMARNALFNGQEAQLKEALLQINVQSKGIEGQITALLKQAELLDADIENMRKLSNQGLARQSQMSVLQRNKAQVSGQIAALRSEFARLDNARRDRTLETLQAQRSLKEEVVTQLREVNAEIEELTMQIFTHRAQLARTDIVAPISGVVHKMQITTKGGVAPAGAELLQIIPRNKEVDFELRVEPRSIDQVYPGQPARLIIASLDPQTVPPLDATVSAVSPDVLTDPRNGQPFYNVVLDVASETLTSLGEVDLVPGMPVEAYLETGDRSVLSYLLHPITSHFRRALRE